MRLALCNAPAGEAERLAHILVQERLVTCVNLFPVQSVYRWDGAVQMDHEVTLLMKVAADQIQMVRERVLELHSYDVAEFVVLDVDVDASAPAYVEWVRNTAKNNGGP